MVALHGFGRGSPPRATNDAIIEPSDAGPCCHLRRQERQPASWLLLGRGRRSRERTHGRGCDAFGDVFGGHPILGCGFENDSIMLDGVHDPIMHSPCLL